MWNAYSNIVQFGLPEFRKFEISPGLQSALLKIKRSG